MDTTFSQGTVITSDWLNYVNDAVNDLPQVDDLPVVEYRNVHKNFAYDYVTDTIIVRDGSDGYHRHFGQIAEGMDGRLHLIYRRALAHGVTSGETIWYTKSDDGGNTWSAEIQLVAPITGFDQRGMSMGVTPTGRIIIIYDKCTAPAAAPTLMRLIYSDDNGETWTQGNDIIEVPFAFARSYGRIKLIPGDADSNWRLAWTPYWQAVTGPPAQYTIPVYTSEDNGLTWTAGTPIHLSTSGYNEAELVAINAKVWFAAARGSGLNLFKTVDAGATWSLVGTIPTNDGVAPSLDKFEHEGKWFLLLGYSDRDLNTTVFKVSSVIDALTSPTFGASLTLATDMVNASGYQSTVVKPDGCVYIDGGTAFIEFKEKATPDSDVRFVRFDLFQKLKDNSRSLSVSSGAITIPTVVSEPTMFISTEGGAATDDLDTINGGVEGQILNFKSATSSSDVTFKNGTGNLRLAGDYTMLTAATTGSRITLMKTGDNWIELGRQNDQIIPTLGIISGAVTVSSGRIIQLANVATEGGAATDDLDTITGGSDGQIMIFRTISSTRDVTFKDGTGNLRLAGDFILSHGEDTITLVQASGFWYEISRSDNNV